MAKTLLAQSGGGSGGILTVTAPVGGIVTISKDGKSKTKTAGSSGTVVFKGVTSGTWTVTLSDPTGVQENVTTVVSINADYATSLAYFSSTISVTYPAGSTCTCSKGDITFTAPNTTGSHTFTVPEAGTYTVSATNGTDTASSTVNITADGQSVSVSLSYQLYASDFNWSSYGTLGYDYEIVNDNDVSISQSAWATTKNWKARLLTSGTLKATKAGKIDVFCVGGGGAGGYAGKAGDYATASGAGGGYTNTRKQVSVTANSTYSITIGAGGVFAMKFQGNPGGTTSAFGLNAAGGYGGVSEYNNPSSADSSLIGGNGGSGGVGRYGGYGGTDGYDGGTDGSAAAGKGQRNLSGPNGETGTTREFGETTGRLYSNGGSNSSVAATPKSDNTGDGGDVGLNNTNSNDAIGGSGIVVIRNAR